MIAPETTTGARKILYVHADAGLYGSGVSLIELASRLPRERYVPLVVLPEGGPLADDLHARGLAVHVFRFGALRRTFRPDEVLGILWGNVAGVRRLCELIRREKVALVHTNSSHVLSGGAAARRTGRPHVGHVRENILPPRPVSQTLARLVWLSSDRVIAVSRAAAAEFLGIRGPHPKLRVIYNGVDLDAFRPDPDPAGARSKLGWPAGNPHVGVVARVAPWKGHRVFLEAAASIAREHSSARFVVVGDSDTRRNESYKASLLALAKQLSIDGLVRWTGFRRPVQPLLAALDVVVVPSVKPEPFGRTLIEAMAMERAVVATDHGGPPEILEQGGGLLVPPGDAQALAAAVAGLLGDERRRADIAKAGRRQALARFDIECHVSNVVALYDEILGDGGRLGEADGSLHRHRLGQ